jgi:hypothetical protein
MFQRIVKRLYKSNTFVTMLLCRSDAGWGHIIFFNSYCFAKNKFIEEAWLNLWDRVLSETQKIHWAIINSE